VLVFLSGAGVLVAEGSDFAVRMNERNFMMSRSFKPPTENPGRSVEKGNGGKSKRVKFLPNANNSGDNAATGSDDEF